MLVPLRSTAAARLLPVYHCCASSVATLLLTRDRINPYCENEPGCHAAMQVGVLQAFDLSLKPGESVYVALRLLPWKERVKTG